MKNKTVLAIFIIILAVLALFVFSLIMGGVEKPVVGENGKIKGAYSLESIMSLNQPYRCNFEMTENNSQVAGTVFTNGKDVYGEFRIRTETLKNEFNSFIIIKDKQSYIWTSLYPFGYQTKVANSASKNATPTEQAQIVGLKDKVQYECDPWQNVDNSTFETPGWITFSKI